MHTGSRGPTDRAGSRTTNKVESPSRILAPESSGAPLRHLVLKRRDCPQRSFRAVRFRDVVPPHWWRDVADRLEPVQEIIKINPYILFIVLSRHTVDACRTVLPSPAIRLANPLDVDQMMQGREHPLRVRPRLFSYPLLFRVRVCGTQSFLQRFPSVCLCM